MAFAAAGATAAAVAALAGPAAAGAGAGLIAPGRNTRVFSKSATLAPPAGASLTYLSLYLPSSMMSLFCRKCFLIDWLLTTVPFVLPRSSRNESCRIVTMTACSPLTARLSIWMSLCGLRPMVVRSLVRLISFRTRPSMLSISFAIAVSLCSTILPKPAHYLVHGTARRGEIPQHPDEYHRNIVPPPVIVRRLHQMLRTQFQVGAQRLQREADIFVAHHITKAVRTEQIDVSQLRVVIVNFRLHNRVDTQRARDEVLVL